MLASLLVIVLEDCAHWWTQDLRIRFNRFFSPWLIMSRYLKPCLVFGRASVLLNCEEVTGSIEFVHIYGLKILELIDDKKTKKDLRIDRLFRPHQSYYVHIC